MLERWPMQRHAGWVLRIPAGPWNGQCQAAQVVPTLVYICSFPWWLPPSPFKHRVSQGLGPGVSGGLAGRICSKAHRSSSFQFLPFPARDRRWCAEREERGEKVDPHRAVILVWWSPPPCAVKVPLGHTGRIPPPPSPQKNTALGFNKLSCVEFPELLDSKPGGLPARFWWPPQWTGSHGHKDKSHWIPILIGLECLSSWRRRDCHCKGDWTSCCLCAETSELDLSSSRENGSADKESTCNAGNLRDSGSTPD